MSKSANPVRVGIFVTAATALVVTAIMVFGASKIFTKTETVICYFHESVNGLDVGAPVKYKGVKIGKVDKIKIHVSKNEMRDTRIAVVMSINLDTVRRTVLESSSNGGPLFYKQVEEGLRAQLAYQSIVTGMLYVELDYFANPGDSYKTYNRKGVPEIPISSSVFADIAKKLNDTLVSVSEINFKEIGGNLNALLVTSNSKIAALDTKQINDKLIATLSNFEHLTSDDEVKNAVKNMNLLLEETRTFVASANKTMETLGGDVHTTVGKLNDTLGSVDAMLAPTSPFRRETSTLMRNLKETSISIKSLADYLERNPSSLLTGRAKRLKDTEE